MLDVRQLYDKVIIPTLDTLGLNSRAAAKLVLGTAIQESGLTYLVQISGPAKGLWQMEPATYRDIWERWLKNQPALAEKTASLRMPAIDDVLEMEGNLYYSCAMCRLHYRRVPEALPGEDDIVGQAGYWKRYYNTVAGAGTVEQYLANWKRVTAGRVF